MLEDMKFDKLSNDMEYKYLVKMPMDSVTEENVELIMNEHIKKEKVLNKIKSQSAESMWLSELSVLEVEYNKYFAPNKKVKKLRLK